MAAKFLTVFCASAVLIQTISAQCIGNALLAEDAALRGGYGYIPGLPGLPYGSPISACGERMNSFTPTSSGGGFKITSSSPISPTGISVISENAIEGGLSVIGELPFLSAVAFEAALPSVGAGGISYGCGNGAIGIVSEGISPAYGPTVAPAAASVASGRFGYGAVGGAPGFAAPGSAAQGLAAANLGAGYGINGRAGFGAVY